jgi:hypothetical protein
MQINCDLSAAARLSDKEIPGSLRAQAYRNDQMYSHTYLGRLSDCHSSQQLWIEIHIAARSHVKVMFRLFGRSGMTFR